MKLARRPAAAAAMSTAAFIAAMLVPSAASAAVPGAPTGLAPNDVSATQYKNLELTWAPVAGATGYEIEISDDGDFDRTKTLTASVKNPSYTVPVSLPNGDYAWRVRAVSAGGKSPWVEGNLTRGWNDQPAWTSVTVEPGTQATSFSWQAIPDASFYEVEVLPAAKDGSSPVKPTAGVYGGASANHWTCYTTHAFFAPYATTLAEDNLPGDETKCYVATASAMGVDGNQPPIVSARIDAFGTHTVQVDASASFDPDGDAITNYTVEWGDGSEPSSGSAPVSAPHTYEKDGTYQISVTATDARDGRSKPWTSSVTVPITGAIVSGQTSLGTSLPSGKYYWRVRGRDGSIDSAATPFSTAVLACAGVWPESGVTENGDKSFTVPFGDPTPKDDRTPECSNWSEAKPFAIGTMTLSELQPTVAPGALRAEPTPGDPAAAVVSVTDTPKLSWSAVPGAVKYRVYVSRTADLRNPDHVYETGATSLQPVGSYVDRSLKTYWAVQACSLNELCGPAATPHAFVKNTVVTLASASTDVDGKLATLTWRTLVDPAIAAGQTVPTTTEAKAYEIQIALEGDWSAPKADIKTDRIAAPGEVGYSHFTVDTSDYADGLYSWRVRPLNQAEQPGKWSASIGSFLRDTAAPTVKLGTTSKVSAFQPVTLSFSEPVTGESSSTVGLAASSTHAKVPGSLVQTSTTTYTFTPAQPWVTNESYSVWVSPTVKDRAGKPAGAVAGLVKAVATLDSASPALQKSAGDAGWSVRTASDATGKSYVVSSDKAKTAKRSSVSGKLRGRYLSLRACRGPKAGQVAVQVDGRTVAKVDLYRSYSGCTTVWTSKRLTDAQHTVKVVALPTKNKKSKGNVVSIDAISAK